MRPLRLGTSAASKEKRLAQLLAGRAADAGELAQVVADAQALGSLELAGFRMTWDELRAGVAGGRPPEAALRLRRAQDAVAPGEPFGVAALVAWQEALTGAAASFRSQERERAGGPPPAPAIFVEARLRSLEQWLDGPSGRELQPAQAGALALARIVEILPFADANGRLARLAASHLMVRGGMRPPILVGADRARLEAALQKAFRLDTEPLVALLQEASERALDIAIQSLEQGIGRPAGGP